MFESRPRWRRGEAERGEVARKKGGWGIGRSDMYMYVLYVCEEKWAFPSEFRPSSYALPPRLFNFNRLPIFPRSIPPRGDLKGHLAWLITFYYPNNIFIEMLFLRVLDTSTISSSTIDVASSSSRNFSFRMCNYRSRLLGSKLRREKRRVKRLVYLHGQ